jgi:hypothetical protein
VIASGSTRLIGAKPGPAAPSKTTNIDQEFIDLFGGKFEVAGSGMSYKKILDFMSKKDEKNQARIIATCISVAEKPRSFVFTGLTKSGKGDRKSIDKRLAVYLPKLTVEDIAELRQDKDSFNEMMAARKDWDDSFKEVNLSMVIKIAYLAWEFVEHGKFTLVDQLINHWGNVPSKLRKEDSSIQALKQIGTHEDLTGETKAYRIRWHQISRFQQDVGYWSKREYVDLFRKVHF